MTNKITKKLQAFSSDDSPSCSSASSPAISPSCATPGGVPDALSKWCKEHPTVASCTCINALAEMDALMQKKLKQLQECMNNAYRLYTGSDTYKAAWNAKTNKSECDYRYNLYLGNGPLTVLNGLDPGKFWTTQAGACIGPGGVRAKTFCPPHGTTTPEGNPVPSAGFGSSMTHGLRRGTYVKFGECQSNSPGAQASCGQKFGEANFWCPKQDYMRDDGIWTATGYSGNCGDWPGYIGGAWDPYNQYGPMGNVTGWQNQYPGFMTGPGCEVNVAVTREGCKALPGKGLGTTTFPAIDNGLGQTLPGPDGSQIRAYNPKFSPLGRGYGYTIWQYTPMKQNTACNGNQLELNECGCCDQWKQWSCQQWQNCQAQVHEAWVGDPVTGTPCGHDVDLPAFDKVGDEYAAKAAAASGDDAKRFEEAARTMRYGGSDKGTAAGYQLICQSVCGIDGKACTWGQLACCTNTADTRCTGASGCDININQTCKINQDSIRNATKCMENQEAAECNVAPKPNPANQPGQSKIDKKTVGIIISASIGGIVLIALLIYFIRKPRGAPAK